METLGKLRPLIEYKFWAYPGQGQSLRELRKQMLAVGNKVLKVDRKNQRLLLLKRSGEGEPVWGCRICFDDGNGPLIITDTEDELLAHADNSHPGWRGQ